MAVVVLAFRARDVGATEQVEGTVQVDSLLEELEAQYPGTHRWCWRDALTTHSVICCAPSLSLYSGCTIRRH